MTSSPTPVIWKTWHLSQSLDNSRQQRTEYLRRGQLHVEIFRRGYAWLDTSTHDSMLDAANFIRMVETRQGLQIACLQESAYENGWMTKDDIRESVKDMFKTEYGQYLLRLIEE